MYQLFVKDLANDRIYELPYSSLSFIEELNKGSDARFSLDYLAVEEIADKYSTDPLFVFSGGKREIWIQKEGTKIFYGLVSDFQINKNESGETNISVAAVDFITILSKRRTGAKREFSATDAGLIAWTLIDESQDSDPYYSDLGITQGTIQTSVDRDRTFRFADIQYEIWQMSNENLKNGFDFGINTSKQFNVYYPTKGSQRENIYFDDQNILSWEYRKPLIMSLTNKVHVLGEGVNDDRIYETRTSSTTYRETFGLLEGILSETDVKESQTLQDRGDKFLEDNQAPLVQLTIRHEDGAPDILDYEVGDSLKINLPELDIDNSYKRVYKRTIDIDGSQKAVISLSLK